MTKKKKKFYVQKQGHVKAPYPHFRYYKKSRHPALIVGEHSKTEYRFRKCSHSQSVGSNSEMIYPNPNRYDPDPMYIEKRVRVDNLNKFEALPLSWRYSPPESKKKK